MDRFADILRHTVMFLWPVPILLGMGLWEDAGWARYPAYAAAAVLVIVAAAIAVRHGRSG